MFFIHIDIELVTKQIKYIYLLSKACPMEGCDIHVQQRLKSSIIFAFPEGEVLINSKTPVNIC
jgi:hypothetical protein